MKIEIENISVMYPNENSSTLRNISLNEDGEFLHIQINDLKTHGSLTFDKNQLKLLRDSLNIFLNNKLIDDIE